MADRPTQAPTPVTRDNPATEPQVTAKAEPMKAEPIKTEPQVTAKTEPEKSEPPTAPPAPEPPVSVEETKFVDGDGYHSERTTTVTGDDGEQMKVTTSVDVGDGGITQRTVITETDGPVSTTLARETTTGSDGVGGSVDRSTSLGGQQISAAGAEGHIGPTDVSGRVYTEGRPGEITFVEGGVHHDETATGAYAGGRIDAGDSSVAASASHESTNDGAVSSAQTDVAAKVDTEGTTAGIGYHHATASAGADSRDELVISGAVESRNAGGEAEFERTSSTKGDVVSESTSVSGAAHLGDREVSGSHTATHDETATTETDSTRVEADYTSGGSSVGGSITHTDHKFDTDENASDDGTSVVGEFLNNVLGGDLGTGDHETTTEVAAHLKDREASVRVTEGSDLDGKQGIGFGGEEIGADYTDREWSSQEATLDDHVVTHAKETVRVVDSNPLDGDLENSESYRESVSLDGHAATVRTESVDRTDINPFDGEVSKGVSSYRGVDIDGTEVSQSRDVTRSADVDLSDGDVGVTDERNSLTVIGDNEFTRSSKVETSVGIDGVDETRSSEFRNEAFGLVTEGSTDSDFHADATGIDYTGTSKSSGPIGSSESTRATNVDTDLRDGDIGVSGASSDATQIEGVGSISRTSRGETSVGKSGVTHEASTEFDATAGSARVGLDHDVDFHADAGGSEYSGSTDVQFGVHHVSDSGSSRTDTDRSDGSIGASAEGSTEGEVLGIDVAADRHAAVQFGEDAHLDVGGSARAGSVAGVNADVDVDEHGASASAGASFLDTAVAGEVHDDSHSVGGSTSGTFLGITITGSADSQSGVQVGVDNDGDGHNETAGELVDDTLDGLGQAAEDTGAAVGEALDGLGDAAEDIGDAIGNFLSGDDDDDDDDDDDGGSLGDAIDNFFSGFGG